MGSRSSCARTSLTILSSSTRVTVDSCCDLSPSLLQPASAASDIVALNAPMANLFLIPRIVCLLFKLVQFPGLDSAASKRCRLLDLGNTAGGSTTAAVKNPCHHMTSDALKLIQGPEYGAAAFRA